MSDVPIPPEILAGILSRLPVEALLRFRCVSKSWCAIIDSKYFIDLHLNHSIKTNTNLYVMVTEGSELSYCPLGSPATTRKKMHNPFGEKLVVLTGSCNGVLYLKSMTNIDHRSVFFNPFTRSVKKVPLPKYVGLSGYSMKYQIEGFGYDHVNHDYKLVRLVQCCVGQNPNWVVAYSKIEVYSLKEGLWREVGDLPYFICCQIGYSVYAAGNLHWLLMPEPQTNVMIAAFDLTTEEFSFVPQPELSDKNFQGNLAVFGGCLCMVCYYLGKCFDVWLMKNYGVKDSWTKLTSIVDTESITNAGFLRPLMYSKSGQDVLFQQHLGRLFWYDLEKKTVKNSVIDCTEKILSSGISLGSLVRVDSDSGSGSGARNYQKKKKKRDDFLSKGFKLVL